MGRWLVPSVLPAAGMGVRWHRPGTRVDLVPPDRARIAEEVRGFVGVSIPSDWIWELRYASGQNRRMSTSE